MTRKMLIRVWREFSFVSAFSITVLFALADSASAGINEVVKPMLRPFELSQVRIDDPKLQTAMEANRRYLLDLDSDRLLHTWRLNAGLPSKAEPLGGWEAPSGELRGHILGYYLSACALMYASTGHEPLKAKCAAIVDELAKCESALGKGGYLSAFPDSFFDRYEAQKQVWSPFCTMDKVMAGLLDQYRYCGNGRALDLLKGMAAYFKKRTDRFSFEQMDPIIDRSEEGGISETLLNLYSVTGEEDHRVLAERLERRTFLNQLAIGKDCLAGRHGNMHIPLVVGAARRYEITGDKRYQSMATFFWDRVVNTRSFAIGGSTNREFWGEPYQLANTLTDTNHETCKTFQMLRLTRHLFCWSADAVYADFHERAFFNGILGTQDPADGMLEYYVPQATGYKRVYGTPLDAFWCCYGTGIETWSKLGDSIYFGDDEAIYVNLFIASTVDWRAKQVRIEQKTMFPEQSGTSFVVHAPSPTTFGLHVRVPGWIAGPPVVRINGRPVEVDVPPASFLSIHREWRDGDEVAVELPMRLHVEPLPDDPNQVAFMYGPVVLSGLIDENEEDKPLHCSFQHPPQPWAYTTPQPYFLADSPRDLSWLRPVGGRALTFRTSGQPIDTTFVPFYQVIGRRYGLYFPVVPKGSDRARQMERLNQAISRLAQTAMTDQSALEPIRKEFDSIINDPLLMAYRDRLISAVALYDPIFKIEGPPVMDVVWPGDNQSEAGHNLQEQGSFLSVRHGRYWRYANSGNWWSWDLKLRPGSAAALRCICWGDDAPPRVFDVLVNGRKIATQTLNHDQPGRFFAVEYPIPANLIQGSERITVRFEPHEGAKAGGIFGCATIATY